MTWDWGWRWFAICPIVDTCALFGQMWLDFPSLHSYAPANCPAAAAPCPVLGWVWATRALQDCPLYKVSWCPVDDSSGVWAQRDCVWPVVFLYSCLWRDCMSVDIRKPGSVSIAEDGQNTVTKKVRWCGFSQSKNMPANGKPWARILCEPSSPCPKGCSRAIGELWKVLED